MSFPNDAHFDPCSSLIEENYYELPLKKNRLSLSPPPKLKKSNTTSRYASPTLNRLTANRTSFPYPSFNPEISETHIEQCFKIICKVGEGSYGNVFKVQDNTSKCVYAAKVTKTPFLSEQDRDRKINEVKLHSLLNDHRNIVSLFDAWEEKGYLYLLMEYCDQTLTNYTKRNHCIDERTVWKMINDILQALHHIHSKAIIHMDVKMDNIMLGLDGNFKLIDFGISFFENSTERPNMRGGDQRYIAPEIINQQYTKAADIFSLGVVALEMAGDFILPYEGELLSKLRRGVLPSNHKCSSKLVEVLKSMMSFNPSDRPSAVELLKNRTLVNEMKLYHLECSKKKIWQIKDFYSNYIWEFCLKTINYIGHGLRLFTNILLNRPKIPDFIEPTPDCTPEQVFSVSNIVSETPPGLTSSGMKEPNSRFANSAIARRHALMNLTSSKNSQSPARNLRSEFSSDENE